MTEITIDGKKYPARLTMGALREYAALTGNKNAEVNDTIEAGDFLWACVYATCRQRGITLPFDHDGMLDLMTPEEVMAAFKAMTPDDDGAKKKTAATV